MQISCSDSFLTGNTNYFRQEHSINLSEDEIELVPNSSSETKIGIKPKTQKIHPFNFSKNILSPNKHITSIPKHINKPVITPLVHSPIREQSPSRRSHLLTPLTTSLHSLKKNIETDVSVKIPPRFPPGAAPLNACIKLQPVNKQLVSEVSILSKQTSTLYIYWIDNSFEPIPYTTDEYVGKPPSSLLNTLYNLVIRRWGLPCDPIRGHMSQWHFDGSSPYLPYNGVKCILSPGDLGELLVMHRHFNVKTDLKVHMTPSHLDMMIDRQVQQLQQQQQQQQNNDKVLSPSRRKTILSVSTSNTGRKQDDMCFSPIRSRSNQYHMIQQTVFNDQVELLDPDDL